MVSDAPIIEVELVQVCNTCRKRHHSKALIGDALMREVDQWAQKHRGHDIEFCSPKRHVRGARIGSFIDRWFKQLWIPSPWLAFGHNANIKLAYGSSVDLTFTSVNSLASDTNLLAGASALAVDNTSALYLDCLVGGYVKNNTSVAPTANKEADLYAYCAYNDTPDYPDTLLGTDATKTITTANILASALRPLGSALIAATTSQVNHFGSKSIAQQFGGIVPHYWSVWLTQNSGQAFAATGNKVSYKPLYMTSV